MYCSERGPLHRATQLAEQTGHRRAEDDEPCDGQDGDQGDDQPVLDQTLSSLTQLQHIRCTPCPIVASRRPRRDLGRGYTAASVARILPPRPARALVHLLIV